MMSRTCSQYDLESKHVFINPSNNPHMNSFISVVVPQFSAAGDVALLHNANKRETDRYKVLPALDYVFDIAEKFDHACLRRAKSVFFLSVGPHNASYILQALESVTPEKVYILITDDEVNRFRRCRQLFRRLKVSKRYGINEDVLHVLRKSRNYFTLREPWGNILESLLEKSLYISDCTSFAPLNIMRGELEALSEKKVSAIKSDKLAILNDARPTRSLSRLLFICACYALIVKYPRLNPIKKIRIYMWRPPRVNWILSNIERVLKKTLCVTLRARTFDLSFHDVSRMSLEKYQDLLGTIDIMPLRKRGGAGGAIILLTQGGTAVFKRNSLNERAFSNYFEEKNLPKYSGYLDFFWRLPDTLARRAEFTAAYKNGALRELEIKERFYARFFS